MESKQQKLRLWQERLAVSTRAFAREEGRMDAREALYRGESRLRPLTELDRDPAGKSRHTPHVRNIVAENIESMVSAVIPQPKVTARRKEDEWRARLIEDMLRGELDRLPFETMNDQMERTVPIQGGGLWLVEWDSSQHTHNTVGELAVNLIHPKQLAPQAGVFSGIDDMDYVILKLPQTKGYILRRYGVDVSAEGESEPEVRLAGQSSEAETEELVTLYCAYYRNEEGGIGRFSRVGDTVLEDLEDYQLRQLRRCRDCNAPVLPEETHCSRCGGKPELRQERYEEVYERIVTRHGTVIPGAKAVTEEGVTRLQPTKIPYYQPDSFPLVLQRNISVYGQLLGESDAEKIADQQNTINRMEKKIIDRLVKAGSRVTLPDRADFRIDPEDSEKWYIGSAADRSLIGVYDFKGDLEYEMRYLSQVYEEARQSLGITDSFQGRRDSSAISGVAKEFAAAQTAGRLESKRVLKEAAYARLFRLMFQFKLAYADEPRSVVSTDDRGSRQYLDFDRYDFLERDAAGEYYWNDQFLFSCDTAAPLANNRERMWENTTAHLSAGAFGDPREPETLVLYWTKMELLHYPGAADTLAWLRERAETAQKERTMEEKGGEERGGNG